MKNGDRLITLDPHLIKNIRTITNTGLDVPYEELGVHLIKNIRTITNGKGDNQKVYISSA